MLLLQYRRGFPASFSVILPMLRDSESFFPTLRRVRCGEKERCWTMPTGGQAGQHDRPAYRQAGMSGLKRQYNMTVFRIFLF